MGRIQNASSALGAIGRKLDAAVLEVDKRRKKRLRRQYKSRLVAGVRVRLRHATRRLVTTMGVGLHRAGRAVVEDDVCVAAVAAVAAACIGFLGRLG